MSLNNKPRGKHALGANKPKNKAADSKEDEAQKADKQNVEDEVKPDGLSSEDVSDEATADEKDADSSESAKSDAVGDSDEQDADEDSDSADAEDDAGADDGETSGDDNAPDDDDESADEEDVLRPEQFSDAPAPGVYGAPLAGGVSTLGTMGDSEQAGFVAAAYGEIRVKRRRRALKAFGITAGVLVGIVLAIYLIGAVVFMGRFLPNTKLGEADVSLKTDGEVVEMLEDNVSDYRLDVVGGGFSYRLTSSDIGLATDGDKIVKGMHEDLNAWEWPLLIMQPIHDETDRLSITYKKDSYEPALTAEVAKFNETAKDPVNATIVFDAATNKFVIQPEVEGTKLDVAKVLASVEEAIDQLESKVSLGNDHLIKPTVYSTDQKLIDAAELASGMVAAHVTLIMGGQAVGEVDGSALSQFVTVNENFEVTFKEEEMNAWVEDLAYSFDTVGTERVYTRADGKEIAVSGGVYGWEVDSEALKNELLEHIKMGTVSELEVPCIQTAAVYNGPNQRDWGNRYIDVDISEQYVRFYGEDGSIIWEAACITGMPDGTHDTGTGVWTVNGKESPSKLIGYENGKKQYETTVTYWMPFEGNGIGFHDATWQPSFGGSMYANGYGSHGCVNLSYYDAESLYSIIDWDDVVVVHY